MWIDLPMLSRNDAPSRTLWRICYGRLIKVQPEQLPIFVFFGNVRQALPEGPNLGPKIA